MTEQTQRDPPPAPAHGGNRGMASMLWSLLPLTALVVVFVIFFRPSAHPVPSIDPAPDLGYAARTMHVRLLTPHGLPARWRATSSDVATSTPGARTTSVRVGYLTADKEYAELVESNRPVAGLVGAQLSGAKQTGRVTVNGRSWTRYRTGRGESALAVQLGPVSVLVTGSADLTELRTLAQSLR